MAKYEARIKGDFNKVLSKIEKEILASNKAISLREKSDFNSENAHCSVRVFDYYPFITTGASILNLTLFQIEKNHIELSAIAFGKIALLPIKTGETKLIEIVQEILQKNFK